MKHRSLNIMLVVIIFIIGISMIIFISINKGSYSITERSFTREELQNMVVSTALSYYYNQRYTDYEQKNMTNSDVSVFGWPTFAISPEMLSRSNLMTVNCAVFVANTYLYSLGYDFSEGYNKYTSRSIQEHQNNYMNLGYEPSTTSISLFTGAYFAEKLNPKLDCSDIKSISSIPNDFPGSGLEQKVNYCFSSDEINNDNKYYYNGERYYKVPSGRIYKRGKNDSESVDTGIIDTTGEYIYYYHTEGEVGKQPSNNTNNGYYESREKQALIKNEISQLLQPGDLFVYRKIDANNNVTGHIMVYVGGALTDNEKGFIHASGNDFPTNLSDFTASDYLGDDNYSVKYDTWDNFVKNQLFVQEDKKLYSIAIIRPINTYCNNNNCTISEDNIKNNDIYNDEKLNNTIARNELSSLRIEQYQYKGNDTTDIANQYNSVNVGDEVGYSLVLTNKSIFDYCAASGAISTEENCTEGYWKTTTNKQKSYNNISLTAKIPEGSTYVYGSCSSNMLSIDCSYDNDTKTLTISNINIPNDSTEYTFNYSVKINDNNYNDYLINEGMTINYNNYELKLDKMSILINNTINNANDIIAFDQIIDNYNTNNTSTLDFIKDVYLEKMNLNLDESLDYSKIMSAIFTEENGIYYKKTKNEINELNSTNKIINNMLVPGLYGGRLLAGNNTGDRAKLVVDAFTSKNTKKRTLEVGDIIIGYNLSSNGEPANAKAWMFGNYPDQKAWMFYGYNENNDAIFVSYEDNAVKYYGPSSITETNSGWRIFRGMYAYDLFVILRPARQITVSHDESSIELLDDLILNKDNMTISNIHVGTSLNDLIGKVQISNDLSLTIKDKNYNIITNRNYVVTGDIINISSQTSETEYTLIVSGDINSDGQMHKDDALILAKYIIDKYSSIDTKYLNAGDMNNDGLLRVNDIIVLLESMD